MQWIDCIQYINNAYILFFVYLTTLSVLAQIEFCHFVGPTVDV